MKSSILTTLVLAALCSHAQITETATEAVRHLGLGWNLGNTLDAHAQRNLNPDNAAYWNTQTVEQSQLCWGQPLTTPEFITMMKDAGFGAIRVPVTWYNHMTPEGEVDAAWMARVKEVVDYVIASDLYCIINVHHDTGADGQYRYSWIKANGDCYKKQQTRFEGLWRQIAETFKDYDHRLIFEGYNEMLDADNSWCYASMNSNSAQYSAVKSKDAYDALNAFAQSFITTVRATGSNNATRNLVITTYSAAVGIGSWSTHLTEPLTQLAIPEDPATDHIILQVHAYPDLTNGKGSSRSLSDVQREVDNIIKGVKQHLVSKGAPVIIGEWGTANVDAGEGKTDYDVRKMLMLNFCKYLVQKSKENGIGTFYWMGLSNGNCRRDLYFNQPDLAETLAKGYHGENFEGKFPDHAPVGLGTVLHSPTPSIRYGLDGRIPTSTSSAICIENGRKVIR